MNWLNTLLSDSNKVSSKRLVLFISLILFIITVILSYFNVNINPNIIDALVYIIISASGLTVIEKFSSKVKKILILKMKFFNLICKEFVKIKIEIIKNYYKLRDKCKKGSI